MFDLIGSLTSEVGLQPGQAKRMASHFLEHIATLLEEQYGDEAVRNFSERLPHWQEWQADDTYSPVEPVHSTSGLIGLDARLQEIFGDIGVDPVKAGVALPALVRYLKSYLPTEQLSQVLSVAPFLSMAAPEHSPRGMGSPVLGSANV